MRAIGETKPAFLFKKKFLSLSLIVLTSSVGGTAYAQLEEVIVTAQKRSQTANEIGMAITTFSGEQLKSLGVLNTTDIAALTPGFTYTEIGTGTPIYTLRGVGFNDQGYNAQSTVTTYIDEIAVPYPVMTNGALLDLERVEVLKGPQGTLYGRNTTGGAINYIAAKPTEELDAGVLVSYGRYDTVELDGYVSGPLGDSFQGRVAARTVQSGEGWQTNNISSEKQGEKDETALRLSIAGQPNEKLNGLLQLSWWNKQSDTLAPQFVKTTLQTPGNAVAGPIVEKWHARAEGPNKAQHAGWVLGQDLEYDMKMASLGLRLNYELGDQLELVSLTGYSKFEDGGSGFDRSGYSGVPFDEAAPYMSFLDLKGGIGNPRDPSTWTPMIDSAQFPWVPGMIYFNDAEIEQFSQELRLIGNTGNVNWVAGLYYSEDTNDSYLDIEGQFITNSIAVGGVPFLGFRGVTNIAEQTSKNLGVYFHNEWNVREDVKLTVGLRYSDSSIDFFGCASELGNGSLEAFFFNVTALTGNKIWFPPGADERGCMTTITDEAGKGLAHGGVNGKLEEDSFSFKIGADWSVTDVVMIYGSYSRGFKSGGFPDTPANVDIQYTPTDQEQLDALELGFKAGLFGGSMQLNGTIFHYIYKDKQLLGTINTIFGQQRILQNVDDSSVNGIELDLQWSPVDGLLLQLAGSWLDSEVDKYAALDALGAPQVFDGSKFPFTAEFQATALASYEWSVSRSLNGSVMINASYSDEVNTDFEPVGSQQDTDLVIDSYGLVNLRLGVGSNDGRWLTSLWARNLTDEYYAHNVLKSNDQMIRFNGMPRTYGVTFEYNFF